MTKKSIVLYLHVHQPWRIRDDQTLFDVGTNKNYFSEDYQEFQALASKLDVYSNQMK